MKVEAVVGTIFFTAAMVLSLLKYREYVTPGTQTDTEVSKYAKGLYYLYGYVVIALKALIVLAFIFVFIMVFNVITLGVFKPLMSDGIGSDSSVYGNSGYNEIILKAKEGYFELLGAVAKMVFATTFHVVKFENAMAALLVFVPLFIAVVSITFQFVWNPRDKKKNKDEEDGTEDETDDKDKKTFLNANYHLLSTIFYAIFVILLFYVAICCIS